MQAIVNGNATFYGNSVNAGVVTGVAVFKNRAVQHYLGTVTGSATFAECAKNQSQFSEVTFNNFSGCNSVDDSVRAYIDVNPPLIGSWTTAAGKRKLVIIGSKNTDALVELFGNSLTRDGGPWLKCPDDGCFAYPALYRPYAYFNFVMDYDEYPNYLDYPGNPEPAGTGGTTLYYKPAGDTRWDNLQNWSLLPSGAVPAPALPTAADSVVISGAVTENNIPALTVKNMTVSQIGQSNGFYINITITGTATFTNSSFNAGTIVGAVEFKNYAYNSEDGTVVGPAFFNDVAKNFGFVDGVGTFADTARNENVVQGTAFFRGNSVNALSGYVYGDASFYNAARHGGLISQKASFFNSSCVVFSNGGGIGGGGFANEYVPNPPPVCPG